MPGTAKNARIIGHITQPDYYAIWVTEASTDIGDLQGRYYSNTARYWCRANIDGFLGKLNVSLYEGAGSLHGTLAITWSENTPAFVMLEIIDTTLVVKTSTDGSTWTTRITKTDTSFQSAWTWNLVNAVGGYHEEAFINLDSSIVIPVFVNNLRQQGVL